MFMNMKFIFPQQSILLSAQKIAVLTKIIQDNAGTVIKFDKYEEEAFIIIPSINENEAIKLCKRLRVSFDPDKFLKPEFISKCITKGKIINMIPYRHFEQQIEESEPINDPHKSYYQEDKVKQKKQKMLQLLHNQMQYQLDYNYEPIIKKEEETYGYQGVPFYGDEDCQIVESHLFDGLDVKRDSKFQRIKNIEDQKGTREKMQWEPKEQKFVCTEGSALVQHNTELIEQLKKLQTYYAYDNDFGRKTSYARAIGQIKSIPFKITDASQLDGMPAIGKKIQEKVRQFLQTGYIQKAEGLSKSVKNQAFDTLKKVFGIGVEKANYLFSQGITTIEDLRKNTDKLDDASIKALEYVDDTSQKIPRDEVTAIFNLVLQTIQEISKGYEAVVCGSYRRLKPFCGDIDILITNTLGKRDDQFLTNLVEKLKGNLIVADLTKPKFSKGYEMYMGICKINQLHRRLDLKVYPREQFGSAVLYFTGSDQFNRSMRLFAQTKGYGLSDHGVFREFRGPHNKSVWKGKPIPCYREEDVFRLLKMDYVPPEKRDV